MENIEKNWNTFEDDGYYATFVGKNWDYYKRSWGKRGLTPETKKWLFLSFKSFNIWAFLLTNLHIFYIKRIWQVFLSIGLTTFLNKGISGLFITLLLMVALGFNNDTLYFNFVQKKIKKITKKYKGNPDLIKYSLIKQGGTSKLYVLFGFLMIVISSLILFPKSFSKNTIVSKSVTTIHKSNSHTHKKIVLRTLKIKFLIQLSEYRMAEVLKVYA